MTVPLRIPAVQRAASGPQYFRYPMNLVLRRGQQTISVLVRDDLGAITSVTHHTVRVPDDMDQTTTG